MDSDDQVQFTDGNIVNMKARLSRYMKDWTYYAGIVLAILAIVLTLGGIIGLSLQINDLNRQISSLKQQSIPAHPMTSARVDTKPPNSGSIYVRWGKNTCPNKTDILYKGVAATSKSVSSASRGGGTNLLCLHPKPQWNKYDMSNDSLAFSWIYGTTYLSQDYGIFSPEVHGHDVPCSVCIPPRNLKVMIPGRRTCPASWTMEYEGYIMSSNWNLGKTSYECIDANPDVIPGTQNLTLSHQMYFVSASCKGLEGSCPPYVDAREITCVVCTK